MNLFSFIVLAFGGISQLGNQCPLLLGYILELFLCQVPLIISYVLSFCNSYQLFDVHGLSSLFIMFYFLFSISVFQFHFLGVFLNLGVFHFCYDVIVFQKVLKFCFLSSITFHSCFMDVIYFLICLRILMILI